MDGGGSGERLLLSLLVYRGGYRLLAGFSLVANVEWSGT